MQTQLAQQLMARANGQGGPSLAEQQLQQTLQQNQAQAAGLIGSQRGINPALAARLIANNQAQQAQIAAGQGAQLRSGEQMGAQGLLAQALAAQRGQDIQNSLGVQGINAGVASGNQQANLETQRINAGVAGQNANISSNAWGGLLGGIGSAIPFLAGGGEVPTTFALDDPMRYIGITSVPNAFHPALKMPAAKGAQPYGADSFLTNDMLGGAAFTAGGGEIPGKAVVAGDSVKNDKVPILASPGEVVIPRSIAQAEDAPEKAATFIRAIQRQRGPQGGYGAVLRRVREIRGKLDHLERMCHGGMVASAPR